MSMFLAGKPRNSKQPKGMCALKISPHSFIAVTLIPLPVPIQKVNMNERKRALQYLGENRSFCSLRCIGKTGSNTTLLNF